MNTKEIVTHNDFLEFLKKYLEDYQKNDMAWVNNDLESFLGAMSNYAEDLDGYYKNTNQKIDIENPTYKVFADILMGAKLYE